MISILLLLSLITYNITNALSNGLYYISNQWSNMYLDCSTNPLSQTPSITSSAQVFRLNNLNDPYNSIQRYDIKCEYNSLCWVYRDSDGYIGRETCSKSNSDQQYMFLSRTEYENSYEIKTTSYYLEVSGTSTAAILQTDTFRTNASNQLFTMELITPTAKPTTQPTDPPTTSTASFAPSQSLTINPTISPSNAPSSAPSQSPLSFHDLVGEIQANDDTILYVVYAIIALAIIISLLSLLYNYGGCIHKSDDAIWFNAILFMLQCVDLYSDILFCYALSIYASYMFNISTKQDNIVMEALFAVSLIFIIVSYVVNLLSAVKIVNKIQRDAKCSLYTKKYFDRNHTIYTLLVLCCGGSVAALAILNSKLFGMQCLNAGISRFKWRQYAKYRAFSTVLMRDLPHIIIQVTFILYCAQIPNIVLISMASSILSTIVSFTNLFMNQVRRKQIDLVSIEISCAKFRDEHVQQYENNALMLYYGTCEYDKHLYDDKLDDKYKKELIHQLQLCSRQKLSLMFGRVLNGYLFDFVSTDIVPMFDHDVIIDGFYCRLKDKASLLMTMNNKRDALMDVMEEVFGINDIEMMQGYVCICQINVANDVNIDGETCGTPEAETDELKLTHSQPGGALQQSIEMQPIEETHQYVMDAETHLKQWGLHNYWNEFKEYGWDDADIWLTDLRHDDTELDKIFGAKTGHKRKFVKKCMELIDTMSSTGDITSDITAGEKEGISPTQFH